MKVFMATDITVRICGEKIYSRSKYATIFKRYFNAFGPIVLCSRVEYTEGIPDNHEDISGITEAVLPVSSLMRLLLGRENARICEAMRKCDLVICRCPSIAAYRAADCAGKLGIPFLSESMGCAWDAYWNHGLVGKLIAPYMFFKMRSVVGKADYAVYVTDEFLQRRYPRTGSSMAASNVLICDTDDAILEKRLVKAAGQSDSEVTLMTTAAVDVKYKGQQYVIEAIPKINQAGIRVTYYIVGEGSQEYLRSAAEKYGVADQVVFTGNLPLEQVFALLDETDIYLQPSLQEGLPRSVIEAMSRGCIVVGANTAGIPELLEPAYVVRRKSADEIASAVIRICKDSGEVRAENAKRNFRFSKRYLSSVLDERRNQYFEMIKKEIGVE